MKNIKIIAFDADDTLWVNEPYFRDTENKFCELLEQLNLEKSISKELFDVEMKNLDLYGYGIKGFILNMFETIFKCYEKDKIPKKLLKQILELGTDMYKKPIELLNKVPFVLNKLSTKYRLVVATKGDLLDQERKLEKSGLLHYFHHIEIMSNKKSKDYKKLLNHLDCNPEDFLMIGNSLKSDVVPVLEIGSYAIHIPFHTTWIHEEINYQIKHEKFYKLESIEDLLDLL